MDINLKSMIAAVLIAITTLVAVGCRMQATNAQTQQRLRSFDSTAARDRTGKRYWGPEQACGMPDTLAGGDTPTAWATRRADQPGEWLLLTYDKPVMVSEVRVYESFNPGAVNRIARVDKNGQEVTIWTGRDPTPASQRQAMSRFKIAPAAQMETIKIYLCSEKVKGWNEIDAVALVDKSGRPYWATAADASSHWTGKMRPNATNNGYVGPSVEFD